METYKTRSDVPEKYKCDLTSFFKNEADFENNFQKAKDLISKLKAYKGCTKNAKKVYDFLRQEVEATACYEDLYVYAYLLNDFELGISENIQRKNKCQKLRNELENNTSFFAPELLELSEEDYQTLFKLEPKLEEYKSNLDKIYREKEHILPDNEEQIIANLTTAMNHSEEIASNLMNKEIDYGEIEIDGKSVTITSTNSRKLMRNKDEQVRKKVFESINKKRKQHSQTFASLLNSYINMQVTYSKMHHFKTSWEAKLFEWNLTDKVFKTLVETTESKVDILQKFYRLKKESLHLDTLHSYDLYLEMAASDIDYSIEETQKLARNALQPLGNDYLQKYDKIIENRYIDYCEHKGKWSGGYSFATSKQDSRILMSYTGTLDAVSTIIHEVGHNVQDQIQKENNPLQYRGIEPILAEVASLTNECLLSSYLAGYGSTKEEKLSGIGNMLETIVNNLFGAVREGKMEQLMYEKVENGESLTKEIMADLAYNSLKKYYGKEVEFTDLAAYNWIARSHYYSHFYLYSYAICICVAASVALDILNGREDTLRKYLEFLKVGSDMWPQDAFKVLGVDLESPKVYEKAIEYFDSLLNKYEQILTEEV